MGTCINSYNQNQRAKPFAWAKTADELLGKSNPLACRRWHF
jgi:hypothetical protein